MAAHFYDGRLNIGKHTFRSKGYSKGSFLKTMKVKSNAPSRIDRAFIKGRVAD